MSSTPNPPGQRLSADAVRHEIVERFTGLGQRKEAHCSCGWYGSGSTAAEREAVVVAHIDGCDGTPANCPTFYDGCNCDGQIDGDPRG